ncbi:Spx/MgsR family RNA polymerase-binding regulatory protein [Melioribacteraceae bacterium 4301-Me]|uniref:Spx/MgsR family RNA polymerase-binding regulatory protein n=1 Tax=Pyranulibacter aquaticus TaxID=3163344 RepID=UPI00359818DF
MDKITIYEKPTCTTCRKVIKILQENGVDFERINYYIEPFKKEQLKLLLKKMNMTPSELLRKNDEAYKKLKAKILKLSEEEILELMIKNPDLIQRPIVEKGEKAILARPPESISKLFN